LLDDRTVDEVGDRPVADLTSAEVGKEEVQVGWNVRLRSVLDNAVAVTLDRLEIRREEVQGSEAVGCNLLVAVLQLLDQLILREELAKLGK